MPEQLHLPRHHGPLQQSPFISSSVSLFVFDFKSITSYQSACPAMKVVVDTLVISSKGGHYSIFFS